MSRSIVRFLLPAAIGILAGVASAQTPSPGTLLAQADELAAQGKLEEAIDAAGQALHSAEQAYGANDQRLVQPLKTLARLYELHHQYAKAETEYQRALKLVQWAPARHDEAAQLKLSILSVASKRAAEARLAAGEAPRTQARSLRARAPHAAPQVKPNVAAQTVPYFPWPPPASSARYELPQTLFGSYSTVGEVSSAILTALRKADYVDWSFFQTEDGGIALVTRLEKIGDDGTPADPRWPAGFDENPAGFVDFVRGLFYAKAGHYRVIVFILQEASFSQSRKAVTGMDAEEWLQNGWNKLPPELESLPFGKHSSCTALDL